MDGSGAQQSLGGGIKGKGGGERVTAQNHCGGRREPGGWARAKRLLKGVRWW